MASDNTLSEPDLHQLDAKLDLEVVTLALLSYQRAGSLMAILNTFEDFIVIQPRDERLAEHAAIHAINGLNFAAEWCLRYCPPDGSASFHPTHLLTKGSACLRSAMEYSKVFDMMSLLWRRFAEGVTDAPDTVRVRVADPDAQRVLIAGRIMDSTNNLESRNAVQAAQMLAPEFGRLARPRKIGASRIKYDIPPELYNEIAAHQRSVLGNTWELDDRWDLGGYTVGEFREFWLTLTTISWIHIYACSAFGTHADVRDSLIPYASRKRWRNRVSHFSGLADSSVKAIMDDLEFRPLAATGTEVRELNCQPFVQITAEILGISSWLVVLTNGEAALWHLISVLRPQVHARLRNLKEEFWLRSLKSALTAYGLDVFPRLPFTHAGKQGDLDLLIIDRQTSFAVAAQLKWLKPPEHVKDRFYNDNELMIGIEQAERSHRWVESRREEVAARTGIDLSIVKRVQFEPLVLSKNTLGSGWLQDRVPVLNERLLYNILGVPHHKDLRTAYLVAKKRTYLPTSDVHFRWDEFRAQFGGVTFVGEGFGVRLLRHWDPVTDIDFSSLDSTSFLSD